MRTFAQEPARTRQTKFVKPNQERFAQNLDMHPMLHLQRTVGNRAVQRLIEKKQGNARAHEGMYGNGGVGTKPDAGSAAVGSAAAPTFPKLSKKTVSPLTKGDCGESEWAVQWQLDKKTTKGGWVVQKVELIYDVKDCSSKPVDPTKRNGPQPRRFPFWEAWQINQNQQITKYAEGGDVNDDTFTLVSPGKDTKGSITVKGTAEFYEGLTLPSSFKVTNGPPAFKLPSTQSAPTLSGGTGAIPHVLKATWDCCSQNKTPTKIESS